MLEKLYDPEGRKMDFNPKDPKYLFDYVRVAPLLLTLNEQRDTLEHQEELNKYTSWMRTFFDGDCCHEFATTAVSSSRQSNVNARCVSQCNTKRRMDSNSALFRVIAGKKECWSENEFITDSDLCLDAGALIQSEALPTGLDATDPDIKAMWALISNGLVTCQDPLTFRQLQMRFKQSGQFGPDIEL
jgi:hypothetical protein